MIAARNISEIGIKSITVHKFLHEYKKNKTHFKRKTVFIIEPEF